jgi:AraC-like DNA-binding protein
MGIVQPIGSAPLGVHGAGMDGEVMRQSLRTALTEKVCLLLDQFRGITDTRIVFYNTQGNLLKAGLDRPDCAYCQLVQNELYSPESCCAATLSGREAAHGKAMHCYECPAGLVEVVIPIHSGGCPLGYAMIGQIRMRKVPPQGVLLDWTKRHGDARLRRAYLSLPLVTTDRLDAICSFLSMLVDSIVSHHLVSLQGDSCVVAAIDYMTAHIGEPLVLPQVARQIGRSPFSVSHAFRRCLQTTFKGVLTEMRLARAEELLATNPHLTVAAVSEQVGFDDPFYFSRVYRKHRGVPPSELLKRLRAATPD